MTSVGYSGDDKFLVRESVKYRSWTRYSFTRECYLTSRGGDVNKCYSPYQYDSMEDAVHAMDKRIAYNDAQDRIRKHRPKTVLTKYE